MKYVYKNMKHVKLHGIEPGKEGTFDHKIEGGGIELVKTLGKETINKNKNKGDDK